jgi:hypothetical protein
MFRNRLAVLSISVISPVVVVQAKTWKAPGQTQCYDPAGTPLSRTQGAAQP